MEETYSLFKGFNYYFAHLDILPVWPSPGIQKIIVYVIFLVREVCLCCNVDHPRTAISTHTQMQGVETGPIKVLFSIKWSLGETKSYGVN